jgi:hypothetical protein
MRMDGVAFNNKSGKKPAVLIFSFTQLVGLNIVSPFDIEIPVPEGEEEKASKIADMHASNADEIEDSLQQSPNTI